ncbi:GDSL esterase/lipase At4g10955-like [Herrania umbratica]|uniref:GDSL esterase/lipase At4g10955-like n=1 Tax=Herrania umbratica TaxID=108875 RepID=A0A6J1AIU4_9ROSI|nr:GDSL esterase/lipase At4g10955-like [Herrania umbratica]
MFQDLFCNSLCLFLSRQGNKLKNGMKFSNSDCITLGKPFFIGLKVMAPDSAIFSLSGPSHLTAIDWTNEHHRRSIAASLVQGVYVLERDRQENRQGPQACALPWWESFNFQLNHLLIDDVDQSIFGAIYEFINFSRRDYSAPQNAPHHVIAFRGTLNAPASISRDLKLGLLCVCNRLHVSSRFQLAMKCVEDIAATATADGSNIWLAGHSLGSAVALLAGKNLTKMGCLVETYLFNPPFLSAPVEILKPRVLKNGIRFTKSVVNAALAIAIKGRQPKPERDDQFTALSSWTPYLFVNPTDVICSEYKGYFEHRKIMEEIGAGKIERLSTQNSIVCLFSTVLRKNSEPLHLLPSAYLTINQSPLPGFKRAHGIEQWWDPNFNGQVELHQFN